MKLKRLELIGFKSFVDKTVILFEKEVTAIVGPNGCGKSNIVDAIRWVMGEQSPKHLRGKQMEDVIFSGSEVRPSLSMASVELTFSTEGYQTPAAYLNHPEISICRRVYRSGESEYFINKTPVRLKDIHDLFLGTGVGTKAYSVIEQGRVTQFLTAHPEERRYYIEEAAGISRFKNRKEGALRKMEATRQNLLRLSDLVGELERQINSLDRQAKKAEKYRELKQQYQKWDLALSSLNYHEASLSQNSLESDLRRFSEEETVSQARLSEEETRLEADRLKVSDTEQKINQLQGELFELSNAVMLSETELRFKKEELERVGQSIGENQKLASQLGDEEKTIENKLSEVNEQKMFFDLERQRLEEEVRSLDEVVQEGERSETALRIEVESLREKIHQNEARLLQIGTLRETQTGKLEELKKLEGTHEEELEKNRKILEETQKLYKEAVGNLELLKQMRLELTAKTDQLTDELNGLRQNLKKEEEELADIREKLTLRKSRLASLEQLQKNFEGYQEGTRSVLLRKQKEGNDGIVGTVADLVESPPEYEEAVSAVLGEKLQYVIVKTPAEGVEAVEYLRMQASGRSSFVPLQPRHYSSDDQVIPQREGVLGPLSRFVSLKSEYQHLSDFLFGDVVLVSDLQKALDIWGSNGHRKTLVTLQGEVVDPTGVISGGHPAAAHQALLSMKREIRELADLIAHLEGELRQKENLRTELTLRAEGLTSSVDEMKHSSYEESVKIANQGKDVDQMGRELDLLNNRQQELAGRLNQEREEENQTALVLSNLNDEERNLKDRIEKGNIDLEKNRAELDACLLQLEEKTARLNSVRMEQAQGEERGLRLEEEIQRLQDEKIRTRGKMAEQGEQGEALEGKRESLERDLSHLDRLIFKKSQAKKEKELNYAAEREAYEKRVTSIREAEFSLKELRKKVEEATRCLNQTTLALTDVRSRMRMSEEQCLERHQLLLSEIYSAHLNLELDRDEAEAAVLELKDKLGRIGEVNTGALAEYEELKTRYDFLKKQKEDLEASLASLERVIQKINRTSKERFLQTFQLVNEKFQVLFPKLFRGGRAKLVLTDENNLLETGVDVVAQPPGKKLQSITLLSGGEKALTAVSLIFSIFQIKPSPFCILDEVDAPLDEANVERYNELLREMTPQTQFVVITHNKQTMTRSDALYGITMQEPGMSQLVSVELK